MAKVIYNGGFKSYYSCTKPTWLVKGKEYEVVCVEDRNWQTDYYLDGVEGNFNSQWFDEIDDENSVLLQGVTDRKPEVGNICEIYKVLINHHLVSAERVGKCIIDSVEKIGNELYRVFANGIEVCVIYD